MRFWDTSAIVPLFVEEESSRGCRDLIRRDPVMVVWCLSLTEAFSACWRRHRAGTLNDEDISRATRRLEQLSDRWTEVSAVQLVRDEAERLLRAHAVRAADALQLGAAMVACDRRPRQRAFVSLDSGLLLAASREGFDAIRPG